ncbi:uncharacterized protein [Elaeis guineensis]|uniref:Uncharacterized protein LOC105046713 isoform X2 n=1 Tax=Elaeis guineensis var. tenera TaxID=51953 RepID=A0A6I9RB53_ELAGV|nr:uncharacterized protein LOC105046713 isoform X2 [Elaeis guineensis]
MEDVGLFKQGWVWFRCQKQEFVGTQVAPSCARDKLVFLIDRHWPVVCSWSINAGKFLLMLLVQWKYCVVRGFWSLISLGSAALFVIMWSCFLSLTPISCVVYVLLSLGAAGAAIHCLGHTPGLFIAGLCGSLFMWIYGNFWITGLIFIAGGYDGTNEGLQFKEQKNSEPVVENLSADAEYSLPTSEDENVASFKSSYTTFRASTVLNIQKEASSSKVIKVDSTSLNEMKRIMNSTSHYEVLGFHRNKSVDPKILKKEYHKKVLLVHPDKNIGNSLACESFKKLQSAFEVLSDLTKKKSYDEQLRKEESGRVGQKSHGTSQQDGVEYRSEESRRIECTKCGNSHIWICTKRSKARARWCQDCSQYHQAKDGDGWIEIGCSSLSSTLQKVEIPRAFVCAESKIFDVSEWAICQGMACRPNTHRPSFHVNMVGLDKPGRRSNCSSCSWGLDAEMIVGDDQFDLWLQQVLASGVFSETPKRRKSWSLFKIHQKGLKQWRRFQ